MSDRTKRTLKRFAKGLAAAGIAYALGEGSWIFPELFRDSLIPVATAALLAAQKWLQT